MHDIISKLSALLSATKITLLMFSAVTCAGFVMGLISAEVFMGATMMILGFYFGQKGTPNG